jgi:hypothetical protein
MVGRCFAPRMHRNALLEPQIPLDVKTDVRHNMFQCDFCAI